MTVAGRYRNFSSRARLVARGLDWMAEPIRPALLRLAPSPPPASPPRSILVIRLDHLGDVLMSTPVLASLRRAFPGARIDVLAAPWGRAALDGNPHVDRVLEATAPWYEPGTAEVPGPVELLGTASRLRREEYDWGFDLRGDPRVALFYLLPAARRRFGFSGLGLEGTLTDSIPYDRKVGILDLGLDLLAAAGVEPVTRRPVFRVDAPARRAAGARLREAGIDPGAPFAVLAPGGNRSVARWYPGGFAGVADALADVGLDVVLTGRAADAPVVDEVRGLARSRPASLAGKTGLRDLAAVLEGASVLISNDSGPIHLAAAVGCPTVAIFGPTDPALTFPYEDGARCVSVCAPIDHARPCFDGSCTSDHGFSRILAAEVAEHGLRVLDRQRRFEVRS